MKTLTALILKGIFCILTVLLFPLEYKRNILIMPFTAV